MHKKAVSLPNSVEIISIALAILVWLLPNIHWSQKVLSTLALTVIAVLTRTGLFAFLENYSFLQIILLWLGTLAISLVETFIGFWAVERSALPIASKLRYASPVELAVVFGLLVGLPLGLVTQRVANNRKDKEYDEFALAIKCACAGFLYQGGLLLLTMLAFGLCWREFPPFDNPGFLFIATSVLGPALSIGFIYWPLAETVACVWLGPLIALLGVPIACNLPFTLMGVVLSKRKCKTRNGY